jgi:hypothetical protein
MRTHSLPFLFMTAILIIPTVGHSGDLEKEFNEKYPKLAEPSKDSRSYEQVDTNENEIVEIGLERTPWYYLDAAVYTVVIKSDGSFTYTGEKNVKHVGRYTGHVSTIDIKPLFQYVHQMDFFSLAPFYSTNASDQPTVYTMIAKREKRKVVKDYGNGGPPKLWALETLIDGLLANASWTEVK